MDRSYAPEGLLDLGSNLCHVLGATTSSVCSSPCAGRSTRNVHAPVKMRTLNEGGHEVFELCSNSDSDAGYDSDVDVLTRGASRSSSPFRPGPLDANGT